MGTRVGVNYHPKGTTRGGHISSDAAQMQLLFRCRLRLRPASAAAAAAAASAAAAAAGSTAGCSTESAREGKLGRRSRSSTPFMNDAKGARDTQVRTLAPRRCAKAASEDVEVVGVRGRVGYIS